MATAKEINQHVRGLAGLKANWSEQGEDMKRWYMMLARRAEGVEEKLQ